MARGQRKESNPKIVVIGGGTGLSVMLRGLKEKPLDITAIVTVADDGGSSGVLRSELHIPPPGDIRNVLMALADVEPLLSDLLKYRFNSGSGLAGHSLGNLMLAAMTDISGDFVTAVQQLSKVLAVRGTVLPASHQAIVLKAEMEDGSIVEGESSIPQSGQKIKRLFIEPPDVEPLEAARYALQEADAIIVGPGSLYTSIMPNLLVPKLAESIIKSNAVKIFVCNVMTQPGETDGFTVSDHLNVVQEHVGQRLFDHVIVNNAEIPIEIQEQYAELGAKVVQLDLEEIQRSGYQVVADRLVQYGTYLRHDASRLSHHIYELVRERIGRKR